MNFYFFLSHLRPLQAFWRVQEPKVPDPLWVLGFTQQRTETWASIEFKVKGSLLVKQGDREWAPPQTERHLLSGIYLCNWGSFNWGVGHLIRGTYSRCFWERGGDFLEDPPWPFSVLKWAFCFQSLIALVRDVLFSMLIYYNERIMRLRVSLWWN